MGHSILTPPFDLTTPDGKITSLEKKENSLRTRVQIDNIDASFRGFSLDPDYLFFNLKSMICQLGLHSEMHTLSIDSHTRSADLTVDLFAVGPFAHSLIEQIQPGMYIGKLFAADPSRLVRDPHYLTRLFDRKGDDGDFLFSLGSSEEQVRIEQIKKRAVAFLPVKQKVHYPPYIEKALPFLLSSLKSPKLRLRQALEFHQSPLEETAISLSTDELLLLQTKPLHIRTTFARIAMDLLPEGYHHTSACILEPTTKAAGNIFEFYGSSPLSIEEIPLEFFTLHPYRENLLFSDRTDLQKALTPTTILDILKTAPSPKLATYVVKTSQIDLLRSESWKEPKHFLSAIEEGVITSEGVMFSPLPPPLALKPYFLSPSLRGKIKRFYCLKDKPLSAEQENFHRDLKKIDCEVYELETP